MRKALLLTFCGLFLAGCEQLGIEDPAKIAAAQEAEGRAVGSGCRYSGRGLEECYALNKRASKAAIFSGWRDMDAYMRENNIEIVPPADSQKKAGEPAGDDASKPGTTAPQKAAPARSAMGSPPAMAAAGRGVA